MIIKWRYRDPPQKSKLDPASIWYHDIRDSDILLCWGLICMWDTYDTFFVLFIKDSKSFCFCFVFRDTRQVRPRSCNRDD